MLIDSSLMYLQVMFLIVQILMLRWADHAPHLDTILPTT